MIKFKIKPKKIFIPLFAGLMLFSTSCTEDLLDQLPTTELAVSEFWKTEEDALYALYGAYADVRPVFDRDYYFAGHGEFTRVRGTSAASGNLQRGDAYQGADYNPTGYGDNFDKYFRYLYGAIHRTNYVIENVEKMLPSANASSRVKLETIIGEARLLRGMVYFRLISMWGDVPYIERVVTSNDEVASLSRMPLAEVKDKIMADFTYAYDKLPAKTSEIGRAAKPAALAFRGKLQLYWASWNNFGWPELETFTPSQTEAKQAYAGAAADFKKVIDDFGLTLYENGDPGDVGELGSADILPNYYYLFTPRANGTPENIMTFMHGGINTGQGEELMRDFAGRSHEGSQLWVSPRYELADRYQSTITGDFVKPLIPMDPKKAGARTAPNSAVNPQSYKNRDFRMKSTIMWDFEKSVGFSSLKSTGFVPFIYKTWNARVDINGIDITPGNGDDNDFITYNTDGNNSGYVFRKFVRNHAGLGRSDGDYAFPVMRLADVFLMYAEASNEVSGPTPYAIAQVNKVRHRGNLPSLEADKTSSKAAFFDAIEQERIVELVAEGHRGFDLRRWRALERVWGPPGSAGVWRIDTHGAQQQRYYQNTPERTYEQNYIFRIPPGERDRNPNLTQNVPWL